MGMRPEPIKRAIDKVGSVKALAGAIGITPQSVSQWQRIPVEHVRAIEKLTGIPKHVLREDVYERPIDAPGCSVGDVTVAGAAA